ncbi:MAG: HAMP domain-containing histidine kinase [Alteromonadaceae bacterium]|nr:HAMP domain-containing histidine kinase [Alteromonadaceae bacterium]
MDGTEKAVSYSIQHRLSVALSLLIVFIGLLSGGYNFYTAKLDAQEWQDNYLLQILNINLNNNAINIDSTSEIFAINDEADTNLYVTKLLPEQYKVNVAGAVLFRVPQNLSNGLHTVIGNISEYRVAIKKMSTGERLIVAQSTIERDELVADNALRAFIPILLLVPLIILLIRQYIVYLFNPIKQTSLLIDQSKYDDFSLISLLDLPKEIHPFVISINQLLIRVSEHISMQQRFIAEAAHELRSPLTALSLQAERLDSLTMSSDAKEQLKTLRAGIERNRDLVSQLLTLAKVQANKKLMTASVPLLTTLKTVLEELMLLAEKKQLDIGVDIGSLNANTIFIQADEHELFLIFKNLIDNAIKYSDDCGVIDIKVQQIAGQVLVSILDSGPGIAVEEISQVFSPFYRCLGTNEIGTGLGLSIVKTITDKLGASIKMNNIKNSGFEVIVSFDEVKK